MPKIYGISLNFAQIGQVSTPRATDCKGSQRLRTGRYIYGTTDMTIADVQPNTGRLCAGTWNRNTGGGIPDYTVCNPTNKTGTAYVIRQRRRGHQQSAADLRASGGDQHGAGRPIDRTARRIRPTACCPLATTGAVTAPAVLRRTPACRRAQPPSWSRVSTPAQAPTRPTSAARPAICSSPRRARLGRSHPWSPSTRTASRPPTSRDPS